MEVESKRGEGVIALSQAKVLLHRYQLGGALGPNVEREGGRKEQRNIDDVVIRGGGNEAKLWLVHLLKFAKLQELMAEGGALFDGISWKLAWIMLRNECV